MNSKILVVFLICAIPWSACHEVDRQIKEAKDARQKSDSVMDEFNKIDDQLKKSNDSMVKKNEWPDTTR
jgi:hypothetical protein